MLENISDKRDVDVNAVEKCTGIAFNVNSNTI